ncbi:ABC transporter substrate-binding protein [Caenimonas aquaedulcis]|uniref:ABC transporter substrate-binding protein n=1 Tax=Caenimonas aquaedulcis TaxID=2793270 RepID=A0A931H140_9BURK|nr:ABC transporter substrate-binding protein [Caenimonas aquaedulcis]MBG9386636.1 ABC transporter substrate-binding protein [Caenimonas aquaedulcis]
MFSKAGIAAVIWAAAVSVHAQDKIIVGQSAPLTGGNAQFGKDIRDGANAYFESVNAKGGIGGKPIELLSIDDKNDRKTAGANAKTLLENKNVVALFGFASATLSLDAIPQAEAKEVPFFAPFSGANPVRVNNPVLFTVRASYGDEMEKILKFWTSLGLKRVTVVHYDDEVGKQNLEVVVNYLKKINLAPQAFPLKRNAQVGKPEIQALIAQQPELILTTVLSGAAAQMQKSLVEMGRVIPTSSLSFVGADQFIVAAGPASAGVSISQVVPNPNSQIPAVRECAKVMEAAGMKGMNSTQLEACFAAKVLTEGMRRAKKPVTAKTLLEALTNLGAYDLGGYKITFGAGAQHGSKFVDLAMVTRDGRLMSN